MTTTTRFHTGQEIKICGSNYRIAEIQRGRRGEERSMYVLDKWDESQGQWLLRNEARCRSSLLHHTSATK